MTDVPIRSLGIFQDSSYQLAIGAGWLLVAMVDVSRFLVADSTRLLTLVPSQIVWILYFTSSDDAWFASFFDIGSSMHFSSRSSTSNFPSHRRGPSSRAGGSTLGMSGPAGGVSYQAFQDVSKGGASSVAGTHGPASVSVHDLQVEGNSPSGTAASLMGDGAPEYQAPVLKARALYSCESTSGMSTLRGLLTRTRLSRLGLSGRPQRDLVRQGRDSRHP